MSLHKNVRNTNEDTSAHFEDLMYMYNTGRSCPVPFAPLELRARVSEGNFISDFVKVNGNG